MKFFSVLSLMLAVCSANAGSISDASITMIMMDKKYGSRAYIELSKTFTSSSKAECHSSKWEYVLDTSTDFGRQVFSTLLAAKAQGEKLNFIGNGSCLHTGIEELTRIELK